MNLRDKTILVTGGCGLIGSTIVDQLLRTQSPRKIIVLDNLTRGTLFNLEHPLKSGQVQLIREDIRSLKQIAPYFQGVDAVFHQAAIRITQCAQEPRECLEVLINGAFNVLQACVDAGVKKVVAASSASIYGMAEVFPTPENHHPYNNRTWYGAAKVANEGMLRSFAEMYKLPYVALRYFNVYGPRMDVFGKYTEVLIRWLDCIDRNEPPKVFGDGKQTMDFVYSEDVARANVVAMESDVSDDVFNVATGKETSLLQLLEALLEVTGAEHLKPQFLAERTINSVPRRWADVSKAERLLGFRAQVDLHEGLKHLVAWRREILKRGLIAAYEGHTPAAALAGTEGRP
jgi:UDP-glucose 4-epimerase